MAIVEITMSMTRQHFEAIAGVIAMETGLNVRQRLADRMIDALRPFNKNFDRNRFQIACRLPQVTGTSVPILPPLPIASGAIWDHEEVRPVVRYEMVDGNWIATGLDGPTLSEFSMFYGTLQRLTFEELECIRNWVQPTQLRTFTVEPLPSHLNDYASLDRHLMSVIEYLIDGTTPDECPCDLCTRARSAEFRDLCLQAFDAMGVSPVEALGYREVRDVPGLSYPVVSTTGSTEVD